MKNKILLFAFLATLLTGFTGYAQDSLRIVTRPEKPAEFKGGLNGWSKFLEKNLDRNLLSKNNAPSGKYTVIGEFTIDSTGAVSDIKVLNDPGYGTADEFIRVLKLSTNKWVPAFDKGKNVAYRHMQSLTLL